MIIFRQSLLNECAQHVRSWADNKNYQGHSIGKDEEANWRVSNSNQVRLASKVKLIPNHSQRLKDACPQNREEIL